MSYPNRLFNQIIHEHRWVDPWFSFRFSLNIFSGCEYSCCYCRANWQSSKKIFFKKNLLEQLKKECQEKKIPENYLIGLGGGINENFSFDKKKNQLSIKVIELLLKKKLSPFIITKNPNLLYDELKENHQLFNRDRNLVPIILISHSGLQSTHREILEPDIPNLDWAIIPKLHQLGFKVGLLIAPLIPAINDKKEHIYPIIRKCNKKNIDFIFYDWIDYDGLMHCNKKLKRETPLAKTYQSLRDRKSRLINKLIIKEKILLRIPWSFYHGKLPLKDEVALVLMHYFFYKEILEDNQLQAFFYAAVSLIFLSEEDWQTRLELNQLTSIPWIGPKINQLIQRMVYDKDFSFYVDLLKRNGFKP